MTFFCFSVATGSMTPNLVQANFVGYRGQAHSFDLEFRSPMLDPEFACFVGHDGKTVKMVQLLTLDGFDPG